ncbi:MAG: beta-ketoacyl-[acyl-carrier-protein] synthase family protein, partial [Chloroflexota bacterium]|nr:beta-ketoacyl-[acyl-carrier-protein] synthase family protein [Chloroflexota bacterium]
MITRYAQRRVVITGLGVLAPNGIGQEAFWQANLSGHSGVRRITRFDASSLTTQIAGEVPDFRPELLGLTPQECVSLDRATQFAVAAANLALHDSSLLDQMSEEERCNVGVFIGSACSSGEEGEKNWLYLTEHGTQPPRNFAHNISVDAMLMAFVPATAIAIHHRLHGPCSGISTGCSAGGDAIGQAFWAIQEGRAERMLAGGSDSAISLAGLNVFCIMRALSTRNDEPEKASRPYDAQRDGFVMAEGAGVLVLEERELALARHAHIYAEVLSFSSNSNAHHMTALPKDGSPLQQLIRQALNEAEITPAQLGYINSHGSSTPSNDSAETAAYKAVFGEQAYRIPISATKSMIGHTQGAASAIETIVTALVLDQQIIPPTTNLEQPEPGCDLDYVPHVARRANVNVALTHSSGFGGVNSAL